MTINILTHLENESGVNKHMAWTQAQKKYAQSDLGKQARLRYQQSSKAKESHKKYLLKRKSQKAEAKPIKEIAQVNKKADEGKIKE